MRGWFLVALAFVAAFAAAAEPVVVGSKRFPEGIVLGEIAKGLLTEAGVSTEHKQGMGGTAILWAALKSGDIAVYCEYTGTAAEEILARTDRPSQDELRTALRAFGVGMTAGLGFENKYALVMRRAEAERLGITRISDLRRHPGLIVAVTPEFMDRKDGWRPLAQRYGLAMTNVRTLDHSLGYPALSEGKIDLKDAYSTDAEIKDYDLKLLEDDLGYFPEYEAVFLYRLSLPAAAVEALKSAEGTIDAARMQALNAEARRTQDFAATAKVYLDEQRAAQGQAATSAPAKEGLAGKILRLTGQHLILVLVSLTAAVLVGVPLGIVASRPGWLGGLILGAAGAVQTIPSLALLVFLIPLLGIGFWPAVTALFLYSLLPIVRNTAAGLSGIPAPLRESAVALGLEPRAQMRRLFMPLALPVILAGVKTSAVINVGTATLAALIGAGGLGEPIVSGLALNNVSVIMQGAIPAALLAILVQFAFDGLDRVVVPRGLRGGAR